MCGIFGIISNSSAVKISIDAIEKLEYRGYDSCGVAFYDNDSLKRIRSIDGIKELRCKTENTDSSVAIAHSRWSTTGVPSVINAHPHFSVRDDTHIAVVHNGIIENYQSIRSHLIGQGVVFESQTDTEAIVHLIHSLYDGDLFKATKLAVNQLAGSYAIAVICNKNPDLMVVAKNKSPLVIGVNHDESLCVASDPVAMTLARDIMYVEDGTIGYLYEGKARLFDKNGDQINVVYEKNTIAESDSALGEFKHHMLKEIYEQPTSIKRTVDAISNDTDIFGEGSDVILGKVNEVVILACGTSYNAGLIAKGWIETISHMRCDVFIASEYEPRNVNSNTLVVTVTQSGETADTLTALKKAKNAGMLYTLTICNSPRSTIARESALHFITKCGPEISVASTKAFTSQLVGLYALANALANNTDTSVLKQVPDAVEKTLCLLNNAMESWADEIYESNSALFLGRGLHSAVAYEGALKLKEISYIHAEGISAGELKHGPLALLNKPVPVIVSLADHSCLDKLLSNIDEVLSRGARVFVITERHVKIKEQPNLSVVHVPFVSKDLSPIIHIIPMQLLSYHVAVKLGRNVDRPPMLAKSVTVE
ncbi:glucosamine--fructose-6-phosphate aminotransferase [Acanthocystis turfacea Chlorella virus MN0810.1]|nr:glucosamine--fructose-6-phosphate aminotransferase [Acanthocystis turfacea Chlorella virus MN0810.1]